MTDIQQLFHSEDAKQKSNKETQHGRQMLAPHSSAEATDEGLKAASHQMMGRTGQPQPPLPRLGPCDIHLYILCSCIRTLLSKG